MQRIIALVHTRIVIELMRPRQWTKNLAVLAAVIFAGGLFDGRALATTTLAFVSFCLASSASYAVNDVLDTARDRTHPVKRHRPVASGRLSSHAALVVAGVLAAAGGLVALAISTQFIAVIVGYLVLQGLYAFALKNVSIVDMLAIAAGFVLRAVGGAVAISVPVSPWLVLCTGLLALFLAAAKRRHELVLLGDESLSHRPVLGEYSAELLDSFMVTLSAATISSYALYTFFETRAPGNTMMLTIPFVVYGVLRYQSLVLRKAAGGRPEEVLLGDGPMLADVTLWLLAAIVALYVAPLFL